MVIKIIVEHIEIINNWITSSKTELAKLKEANSWISFQKSFESLVFQLNILTDEIISRINYVSENIYSGTFGPYQAFGLEFPHMIEVEVNEQRSFVMPYNIPKGQKSPIIFPELNEVGKIIGAILSSFEEEPLRLVESQRKIVEEALQTFDETITAIEKFAGQFIPNLEDAVTYWKQAVYAKLYFKKLGDFQIRKLNTYFKKFARARQDGKVYQYQLDFGEMPGLDRIKVDFERWHNQVIINEEIKNKEKELNNRLNVVATQLKEVGVKEKSSRKLLSIFGQMNPEFPVNIDRLAELLEEDKVKTEETILYTLSKYPDIGKYDQMAQMLVFSKNFSKKQEKQQKELKCPKCKTVLQTADETCPNCGRKFEICQICRGIIIEGKTKDCNSCGRKFHKEHLEEWMNTNRNCPVCKEKI